MLPAVIDLLELYHTPHPAPAPATALLHCCTAQCTPSTLHLIINHIPIVYLPSIYISIFIYNLNSSSI